MKSKLTWFQFHFKKFLLSYLFIHFFPPLGYFVFFSTFATFHDVSQRLYGCTSLIFLLFFFSAKFSFILIFLLLLLQSYFVRRCANWKNIFVFFISFSTFEWWTFRKRAHFLDEQIMQSLQFEVIFRIFLSAPVCCLLVCWIKYSRDYWTFNFKHSKFANVWFGFHPKLFLSWLSLHDSSFKHLFWN